jgi:hypothetical protein
MFSLGGVRGRLLGRLNDIAIEQRLVVSRCEAGNFDYLRSWQHYGQHAIFSCMHGNLFGVDGGVLDKGRIFSIFGVCCGNENRGAHLEVWRQKMRLEKKKLRSLRFVIGKKY